MFDPWILPGVAALLLRAGFALYIAGISRSKNTISALFRVSIEIAIGILMFWAFGAAIRDGSWGELFNPRGANALFIGATYLVGPAIVAGAALERSRTIVCIAAALMMPGLLTPVVWKLLHCRWILQTGFVDEAGAVYTHFSAGIAAAVVAIALGPRLGKYNRDGSTNAVPGHNLPLVAVGVFVLLVMWIPYVAGYAEIQSRAALNAVLAAAAAMLAACVYCELNFGRQDVLLVYSGLMGGLVSVTAGADRIAPWAAVVTGVAAGMIVPWIVVRLDLVWKIDDPAGGITVHGVGGILSAIAVSVLAPGSIGDRANRLGGALAAMLVVGILTLVVSCAVFLTLRATTGIRVREADEIDGLDLSEFDLNAYPDFQQITIKSYHLREM